MIKVRLKRVGRIKLPIYNIVVADSRAPRDGKFIEKLGFYNPFTKELNIKVEKYEKWIKNGAQTNESVKKLMNSHKIANSQSNEISKDVEIYKKRPFVIGKELGNAIKEVINKEVINQQGDVTVNIENNEIKKFLSKVSKETTVEMNQLLKDMKFSIEKKKFIELVKKNRYLRNIKENKVKDTSIGFSEYLNMFKVKKLYFTNQN